MSSFFIASKTQAEAILEEFEKCRGCGNCDLNTAEGWKCSYLVECAREYLERHRNEEKTKREHRLTSVLSLPVCYFFVCPPAAAVDRLRR